jgi:S-adenosylmethionine synthetase
MKLFTTEQVSKYHPDKVADQISDAIVRFALDCDENARVAVETMVKGKVVILGGEVSCNMDIPYEQIALQTMTKLGYPCYNVMVYINQQSEEIAKSVDNLKAGDQCVVYGYAYHGTPTLMPVGFDLANEIIERVERDVEKNPDTILKGDAKVLVTTDFDTHDERANAKVNISVCHKEKFGIRAVREYMEILLSDLVRVKNLTVNPAGTWNIGGPTTDCGVTGRKIVCDQYGGVAHVGGGAFSGKDPTKLDRTAAYMARQLAVEMLRKHELSGISIQLAYMIGKEKPVSISLKTMPKGWMSRGDLEARIAKDIRDNYDLTPAGMIKYLDMNNLDFEKIAGGCHFRAPLASFKRRDNG